MPKFQVFKTAYFHYNEPVTAIVFSCHVDKQQTKFAMQNFTA